MTEPTDAELLALIEKHLGFKPRRDDTVIDPRTGRFHDVQRYRDMKADILAKWGTPPAVAGEAAEHYRNAIARACEGWTMPDGLRKHLETALWSPPTQAAPPAGREPVAWLSTDCIGERYLCFTKPKDSNPARPLVFGDTTPQPTQAQAGAVPLTDEQIADGFAKRSRHIGLFAGGVRFAERHHGIKGCQHEPKQMG